MEENFNSDEYYTDEEYIYEQEKYFVWYAKLPKIFAIATLVMFFIASIVFAAIAESFWVWLVVMIIGAVLSVIEYFVGKIILSQKILTVLYLDLTVLYLEQLNKNLSPKEASLEDKAE